MKAVFVLQHAHVFPGGEENVKFIGVYRSSEAARAAIERLKTQPGFRDFPRLIDPTVDDEESGFNLDEYELDADHWTEGFVSA
ncbi:MAG: serine kinase [Verrucomicrobiota bacterium]